MSIVTLEVNIYLYIYIYYLHKSPSLVYLHRLAGLGEFSKHRDDVGFCLAKFRLLFLYRVILLLLTSCKLTKVLQFTILSNIGRHITKLSELTKNMYGNNAVIWAGYDSDCP